MLSKSIIDNLFTITKEEQDIIAGGNQVDLNYYTESDSLVFDYKRLIDPSTSLDIRRHTRFVKFPRHKHNYVEMVYVFSGQSKQTLDGKELIVNAGEIVILNQLVEHEIEPANYDDIMINFVFRPDFFDYLQSLSQQSNLVFNFLINTIYSNFDNSSYLYFKVADIRSIQEIMAGILTELVKPREMNDILMKLEVGRLLVELLRNIEQCEHISQNNEESNIVTEAMRYIDKHYQSATLKEFSSLIDVRNYKISRIIKEYTNSTFKEILQAKRISRFKELLTHTDLPLIEISSLVGYENLTHVYDLFERSEKMTPNEYRLLHK